MRVKLPHSPYIANKISIDLLNCGFVKLTKGLEIVSEKSEELIIENIKKEIALENRVSEILEENEDEIEFMRVDSKQLFWMTKKKLAKEYNVILASDERYNDLAHTIVDELYDKWLLEYKVSVNKVKNVVFEAIVGYIKSYEDIESIVIDRIEHYKRPLIAGTDEYNIIFQKFYEEELKRKGMF